MALDMHEVSQLLAARIQQLAPELVGSQPTNKSRLEWRFYPKGGLAVAIAGANRGCWFDHGAGAGGDALDLVVHLRQCTRREAWQWSLMWLGGDAAAASPPPQQSSGMPAPAPNPDLWKSVWREGTAAPGSLVEIYLASRRLALPVDAPLKFHAACPRGNERLPAMLAMMTDPVSGAAVGVHRTFLRPDGSGKADVQPAKMMLGNAGVVRLAPDEEVTTGLGICEGIENALAVIQHVGWSLVWAAGSAGGLAWFPVLAGIESLTVFADHDEIKQNGKQPGIDAARVCAARWRNAGREVRIIAPRGLGDWNDVAREIAA